MRLCVSFVFINKISTTTHTQKKFSHVKLTHTHTHNNKPRNIKKTLKLTFTHSHIHLKTHTHTIKRKFVKMINKWMVFRKWNKCGKNKCEKGEKSEWKQTVKNTREKNAANESVALWWLAKENPKETKTNFHTTTDNLKTAKFNTEIEANVNALHEIRKQSKQIHIFNAQSLPKKKPVPANNCETDTVGFF